MGNNKSYKTNKHTNSPVADWVTYSGAKILYVLNKACLLPLPCVMSVWKQCRMSQGGIQDLEGSPLLPVALFSKPPTPLPKLILTLSGFI